MRWSKPYRARETTLRRRLLFLVVSVNCASALERALMTESPTGVVMALWLIRWWQASHTLTRMHAHT